MTHETNEHALPIGKAHYPTYDWGSIISRTFHDLFDRSWAQNLVVGVALLFVSPLVVFLFMKSVKGMLFGFGAGITILFWIGWCSLIKHVVPAKTEPETVVKRSEEMKENLPSTPNINITSKNQSGGFTGINQGTINLGPNPRVITEDQLQTFNATLRDVPRGKVQIMRQAQSPESDAFSQHLKALLIKSGFQVNDEIGHMMVFGFTPPSLSIGVANPDKQPIHAGQIQTAFRSIGIDAQGTTFGTDEEVVTIVVGEKAP